MATVGCTGWLPIHVVVDTCAMCFCFFFRFRMARRATWARVMWPSSHPCGGRHMWRLDGCIRRCLLDDVSLPVVYIYDDMQARTRPLAAEAAHGAPSLISATRPISYTHNYTHAHSDAPTGPPPAYTLSNKESSSVFLHCERTEGNTRRYYGGAAVRGSSCWQAQAALGRNRGRGRGTRTNTHAHKRKSKQRQCCPFGCGASACARRTTTETSDMGRHACGHVAEWRGQENGGRRGGRGRECCCDAVRKHDGQTKNKQNKAGESAHERAKDRLLPVSRPRP